MKKIAFIAIGTLFTAAAVYVYATPYIAAKSMQAAAINKDPDKLSALVDFPAVKESIKANLNAKLASEMVNDKSENPFAALGAAMAGAIVNQFVETMVTPEGLAMMMKGDKPDPTKPKPTDTSSPLENTDTAAGYVDINSFRISVKKQGSTEAPLILIMTRNGVTSWKLTSVRIPL